MLKKALCLIFAFLLSINSFGAVVSDNDGSAFITKAEFDSLKNNFQSQLDGYNTAIDSKIDNAISSYLAGIKVSKSGDRVSLRDGIIWSIGPFDRPRFKHGTPIWDIMSGRIVFPDTTSSNREEDRATYIMLKSSWGDNFTNKLSVVNDRWGYDDILLNNVSGSGALLDGWYGLCGHWKQIWYVNNLIAQWSDPLTNTSISAAVPNASPQNTLGNEKWSGNFRPTTTAKSSSSWPPVQWVGNPFLGAVNGNGNVNYSSITKGNQIKWNNNISAFGPIDYRCFATEFINKPENYSNSFLSPDSFSRDEKCYIELPTGHYNGSKTYVHNSWNLLRWTLPDPDYSFTPAENPWNSSSLPGYISELAYAYHNYIDSSNKILLNGTVQLYATRGFIPRYQDTNLDYMEFKQHMYIQEPTLETRITNWNKIGLSIPIAVNDYINKNGMTSQLLTLDNGSKALSLAAGVPIVNIEKNQKITIKGEFRKDCNYTYNASTKTSTLNEGSKDTTDAYVIYAKYSPFNINLMPEYESDLLDISSETPDSANVDRLAKCRIVRDGNINITIENDTENERLVFLKWEKLSNWSTVGTTRKTGNGTNTDVHVVNTRTGETIAAPTWTYYGGGFAKFDKTFKWENIDK